MSTPQGRSLDVRSVREDELVAWYDVLRRTFFIDAEPEAAIAHRRPDMDLGRTLGAFDGDRVVATFRSFPSELTVGGGVIPVDAVTNVTVAATHRRRGLLTEMMRRNLDAAKERGDAASILIASEAPIYGRYGYGPATEAVAYDVDTRMARFRHRSEARVESVDVATMRRTAPAIYDSYRRTQPGAIQRNGWKWDTLLRTVDMPAPPPPLPYHLLSYDAAGQPDGYVRYHVAERWERNLPAATLTIDELVGLSPAAHARLWQHCCEVDLVTTVRAPEQSVDDLLPWLLVDPRAVSQTDRTDRLWLRVLNVPAAVGARALGATGSGVIEVIDDAGYASGRYQVEGDDNGCVCTSTTSEPDVRLPVQALGAVLLGGHRLATLHAAGWAEECREGGVRRLGAMFASPVAPWCNTWF